MRDWSDLLIDILNKIARDITYYEDFVNFVDVCDSWKSSVMEDKSFIPPLLSRRFPCLMLAEAETKKAQDDDDEKGKYRQIFFLTGGGMVREVYLPEVRNQRLVSTRGWLLVVDVDKFFAKLVHPFTRIQIDLPNLGTFPDYERENMDCPDGHCIRKVIFTSLSNPLSESFYVFVIWASTGMLGFCKLGDSSWTHVTDSWRGGLKDIVYHHARRRLYAVNGAVEIEACDIHAGDSSVRMLPLSTFPKEFVVQFFDGHIYGMIDFPYLLEWGYDHLLVVLREVENDDEDEVEEKLVAAKKQVSNEFYATIGFNLFLYNLNDNKWSVLESLGDKAVFLGYNSSFSTDADGSIVKPNCIYFTDDVFEWYLNTHRGGGIDMGIYNVSDKTVEYFRDQESFSRNIISPPLWLEHCHLEP